MNISNIIDNATTIVDKIKAAVEKYVPDPAVRANIFNDLDISRTKAQFELDKLQVQMNMDASKSPKWRDWLARVCVSAIAYHMFIHPLAMQVFAASGHPVPPYIFDTSNLNQLVYALLGLAGFETAHSGVKAFLETKEKINDSNNSVQ